MYESIIKQIESYHKLYFKTQDGLNFMSRLIDRIDVNIIVNEIQKQKYEGIKTQWKLKIEKRREFLYENYGKSMFNKPDSNIVSSNIRIIDILRGH